MPSIETVSQDSVEISATLLEALRKRLEAMNLDESELLEIGELVRQVTNLQRGLAGVVKELRSIKKDAIRATSDLSPERQVAFLRRAIERLPKKYQRQVLEDLE